MPQVQRQEAPSRLAVREDRLLHLFRDKGPQTVGRRHTLTTWPRTEINTLCEDLVSAHVFTKDVAAKAVKYSLNGMEDARLSGTAFQPCSLSTRVRYFNGL